MVLSGASGPSGASGVIASYPGVLFRGSPRTPGYEASGASDTMWCYSGASGTMWC